jgi:hypothetical protein
MVDSHLPEDPFLAKVDFSETSLAKAFLHIILFGCIDNKAYCVSDVIGLLFG